MLRRAPQLLQLEGGRNLKRWGLVGSLQITEGHALQEDSGTLAPSSTLFCFPIMRWVICFTTHFHHDMLLRAPNQQHQPIMDCNLQNCDQIKFFSYQLIISGICYHNNTTESCILQQPSLEGIHGPLLQIPQNSGYPSSLRPKFRSS